MSVSPFAPRPENERVFFAGVAVPPECCAQGRRALRWRQSGLEWVRPLVAPEDWRGDALNAGAARQWVIDFPPGADERTLVQAGGLGRVFQRAGGRVASRGAAAELRIALAKIDRYLASPRGGTRARWRWVPAEALPGRGLVVAARDDEFVAGVLGSAWLEVWLRGTGTRLGAAALRSFPLPWAPDTLRGSLSREQEEQRAAVVRAWRAAGGGTVDLDPDSLAAQDLAAAVAAAYGWPAAIEPEGAMRRLAARARPAAPKVVTD